MKSSLLFYKKFFCNLITIDLSLHPYDPCVSNKVVNSSQIIVVWHSNDLKVSHYRNNIVTRMFKRLNKTYERSFEDVSVKMKISRDKIHEYICITLDFSAPGEFNITIVTYIEKGENFYKYYDTMKTFVTPVSDHCFKNQYNAFFSRRHNLRCITILFPRHCFPPIYKG